MALPLQKSPLFPQHTAYYFIGRCHTDLVSYPSYQRSPRLPCPVFISATIQSSLYTRHHNNHKCSDRFAGTAVRGEASERESESEHERKRETHRETERERETPTHPKPLITVHYVPRSCKMLDFKCSLATLFRVVSYIHFVLQTPL